MTKITIESDDLDDVLLCLVSVVSGESMLHFPAGWRETVARLAKSVPDGTRAAKDYPTFFAGPEDPAQSNEESDGWDIRVDPPLSDLESGEILFLTGKNLNEPYSSLIRDGVTRAGYYLNVDTGREPWLDGPYMTVIEALQEAALDRRIAWHQTHESQSEVSTYRHGYKLWMKVSLDAFEVCSIWRAPTGVTFVNTSPDIDPRDFGVVLAQAVATQSAMYVGEHGGKESIAVDVAQNAFNDFLEKTGPAGVS